MKMRRWILLDLWVLSLAAISCYGGAVSYGIFFGITLIPVVSLLYLGCAYLHLRVLQQIESRNTVCGEAVPYLFILKNDGFCLLAGVSVDMFSSFSTVEELPGDREYELLPRDSRTFETKLTCKYRGEYEVGVKEIIMTDFFRLFRVRYRIPHGIKAKVLPKVTHVSELKGAADLSALIFQESMQNRTEPDIVVRDYIAGDAVKQIHWKATAREGKPMVRSRVGEEKRGIALVWDTCRVSDEQKEYLPLEDKILETVLALGIFFAKKDIPFLAHYGVKGIAQEQVRGLPDFDRFYRNVSETVFDGDKNFAGTLREVIDSGALKECRVLFGVLHEMNGEIVRISEELDRAGVMSVFYVVTDREPEEYIRQGSRRHRIIAIPVDGELEGRL